MPVPGIYYGYRKKHEMTDIKTLVRKLLAGKLPQKEMPELWRGTTSRNTCSAKGIVAQNRPKTTSCCESRIWERIVTRTMPPEKNPAEGRGTHRMA